MSSISVLQLFAICCSLERAIVSGLFLVMNREAHDSTYSFCFCVSLEERRV